MEAMQIRQWRLFPTLTLEALLYPKFELSIIFAATSADPIGLVGGHTTACYKSSWKPNNPSKPTLNTTLSHNFVQKPSKKSLFLSKIFKNKGFLFNCLQIKK